MWLIPVGTKGWVVVYRVPRSRMLCTSDKLPEGYARDRFSYVLSDGFQVPLLEDQARQVRVMNDGQRVRLLLFIGTADEQEAALGSVPEGFR